MAKRWYHRSCPICEASCGLRILADRESREVLRIEGNENDPVSQGHLCPKAMALKGCEASGRRSTSWPVRGTIPLTGGMSSGLGR